MTVNEFAQLTAAIKTYFPRDNVLPTEEAMDLWYAELKDLDYESASMGLRRYVATSRFAPAIADIREHAADYNEPDLPNEMAAWQLVLTAIRNSGYHAEEEFAKLPGIVQRAVVNPGQLREWALSEDVDGTWMNVTQSNFMRVYRAEAERARTVRKLPPDTLKLPEREAIRLALVESGCMQAVEEKGRPKESTASQVRELKAAITDEQWAKRAESLKRLRNLLQTGNP